MINFLQNFIIFIIKLNNMQNFGKLKDAFNGILVEGVVTNDTNKKNIFSKYVKTIKENKILRTQFLIYNNIETKIEENEFKANLFLQENINLLNKFNKKEIFEANKKISKLIPDLKIGDEVNPLYENISTLIFTERNSETIDTIVEATTNIIKYILENKPREIQETIELPNSMLTSIMVEKYNDKYSEIDESEAKIIKSLIDSDDVTKRKVYTETVRECIDLINEKLVDSSLETKDRLLKVKDKLLNDTLEINEDYYSNISKLVDLKDGLK